MAGHWALRLRLRFHLELLSTNTPDSIKVIVGAPVPFRSSVLIWVTIPSGDVMTLILQNRGAFGYFHNPMRKEVQLALNHPRTALKLARYVA